MSQEAFNVDEFLVFSESTEIAQEASQDAAQNAENWPDYPDLFPEELKLKEDPMSLINFEGASLYKEEYVDPFAQLSPKYDSKNSRDFLTTLELRRKKLDNLAKNLQTKNPLEEWARLEDSLLIFPWQKEVQVYNCRVENKEVIMKTSASKMLGFFRESMPEYLI